MIYMLCFPLNKARSCHLSYVGLCVSFGNSPKRLVQEMCGGASAPSFCVLLLSLFLKVLTRRSQFLTLFLTLTFLRVLMATVSMKLAGERSRMMEWISQVHFPSEPRETLSRSLLSVSSLLDSSVVMSPSCRSDMDPSVVVSGSVPFRYTQLLCGVSGMTNTVPFSRSLHSSSGISPHISL